MSRFLLHYAVNALWQVPLLTLTGALIARLVRPSLLARHLLAVATLLLAIVMPLTGFSTAAPAAAQASLPAAYSLAPEVDPLALPAGAPVRFAARRPAGEALHGNAELPHAHAFSLPPLSSRVQAALVLVYLLALLVALSRFIVSALHARRLYASSTPAPLSAQQTLFVSQACAHFGVASPLVRVSADHRTGPLLTGLAEPAILLPASLVQAAPAEFAAVIVHELAHLHRRDLTVNLALRIAALPIAFHPATLVLHASVRHTRELLTDRLAAAALHSPTAYARSLLSLSERLLPTPAPNLAAGLFEQRHPSRQALEERVMKLIAPPAAPPRFFVRAARAAAAITISAAAIAAVSLLHVSPALAAQQVEAPAPPSAPAPLAPAPGALTTSDSGQTFTATHTDSTPTSTDRQTYTTTDPHAAPPAVPTTYPASEPAAQATPAPIAAEPSTPVASIPPLPPAPPATPTPPETAMSPAEEQALHESMAKMQADMANMQRELQTQIDPQMKASLEAMRKQLESPEFRRQIAEATDAAARVHADLSVAELGQLQTNAPANAQREALRQAFHQRVDKAKRTFREQLHAAGTDSAQITQASNQFSAEMQAAAADYTTALLGNLHK